MLTLVRGLLLKNFFVVLFSITSVFSLHVENAKSTTLQSDNLIVTKPQLIAQWQGAVNAGQSGIQRVITACTYSNSFCPNGIPGGRYIQDGYNGYQQRQDQYRLDNSLGAYSTYRNQNFRNYGKGNHTPR